MSAVAGGGGVDWICGGPGANSPRCGGHDDELAGGDALFGIAVTSPEYVSAATGGAEAT